MGKLAQKFINEVIGMRTDRGGFPARARRPRSAAIDPDFAPAHARLGSIAMFENDLPRRARHFERALALDPTDLVRARQQLRPAQRLGRLDEAIALDEAVVLRDPVNTTRLFNLACA